jgi:Asp-tRNA(Asn)/Glu-tRNA(Gln) amidotransferase A subunit family amidase
MALSDGRVDVARLRLSPACVKAESCYDTIFSYEVARKLARDRDREPERLGTEVQSRIDHGRRIDAATYEQARRDALGMRSELLDHLIGDSVILDVASEDVAPPHDLDSGWSPSQALWALAGIPTLTVPCGLADGLPVGVQIAAAPGREDLLARVACIIEDRIGK